MIAAILVISAIACLFLGGLVISQDIKKTSNLLFAAICVCFAVWAASILLFLEAGSIEVAFFAAKTFYVVAGLFPGLLLLFALIFPEHKKVALTTQIPIILAGVAMTALLVISPQFVVGDIILGQYSNYAAVDQYSYILYSSYFVTFFFSAMFVAFRKFAVYKGNLRMQAGLYAFGILLNSVPGFVTNLFLPYYGVYDYIWVGPAASVFFLSLTTYGIIKHGLFDIRLAAVRTTTYAFSLLTLVVIYYLVAYLLSATFLQRDLNTDFSVSPLNILLALVLTLTFQPVKRFFDNVTDKIFFRNDYSLERAINQLGDATANENDLRQLTSNAQRLLFDTLKPTFLTFSIIKPSDHPGVENFVTGSFPGDPGVVSQKIIAITDKRAESDDVLFSSSVKNSSLRGLMEKYEIAAIVLFRTKHELNGYALVGEKQSGSAYRKKDWQLLNTAADELALAIQNALRFEEIRAFNRTLQDKVDEATIKLRRTNAKLQELDEAKDEFVSMASHQLRTPLTSVKGYLSMVLEGDAGELRPSQKKLLEEAYAGSQRMVYLIGDFLNVSRMRTGKFMLEYSESNLAGVIDEEIDQLRATAEGRNMNFIYEAPKSFPSARLDENKIRQVIMNLIDNAIYYSKPGGTIKVELYTQDEQLMFRVKDNGIGVPLKEQKDLFEKFFRATNARKVRPDGTGLGLFMIKKVVLAHGGTIIFSSHEHKGSVFGFTLPMKRPVGIKTGIGSLR